MRQISVMCMIMNHLFQKSSYDLLSLHRSFLFQGLRSPSIILPYINELLNLLLSCSLTLPSFLRLESCRFLSSCLISLPSYFGSDQAIHRKHECPAFLDRCSWYFFMSQSQLYISSFFSIILLCSHVLSFNIMRLALFQRRKRSRSVPFLGACVSLVEYRLLSYHRLWPETGKKHNFLQGYVQEDHKKPVD